MIVSIASIQARARNAAATGAAAGTAACPYIEGTDAAALFHQELQAELALIQTAQQHFRFIEFNDRRAMRSAPAARVEVDPSGEWLWMTRNDIRLNIRDHGEHAELRKAMDAYGAFA